MGERQGDWIEEIDESLQTFSDIGSKIEINKSQSLLSSDFQSFAPAKKTNQSLKSYNMLHNLNSLV